tara:strand:+ start:4159 stop:4698 length:540 start_codon:yes stop_codon:yes gene_type:complete
MEKENIKNKFTDEQILGWEDYRQTLYIQKSKSDELFEKAVTFIASGALGLTLTFHDKIVPVNDAILVILIALGWALLVGTLFINLISHYKSSKSVDYSIDDVDKLMENSINYITFQKNLLRRNKLINSLNKVSIGMLGIGLFLITIYVSVNIHFKKSEDVKTDSNKKISFTVISKKNIF